MGKIASNIIKKAFPVTGMSCASCAISAENGIKALPGVVHAAVNYANASLLVEYTQQEVTPEKLKQTLQSIGYDLVITEAENRAQEEADEEHYTELIHQTIGSAVLSLPLLVIAMVFPHMPSANYIMLILSIPVVCWFGRQFFVRAWKQLKHRSANMDTLVALSTGIAFLFSTVTTFWPDLMSGVGGNHGQVYFEAAAVVITFILLGKLLEEKAKSRTSSALKKLIGLQPNTVYIIQLDGNEKELPLSVVKPGDTLFIKPGNKVAVDGTLLEGNSFVDESMISGEPLPVEKMPGDSLYAGTINQKGSFRMRADKVGGETILAGIIAMVREAQGSKAPVQQLVDKVAAIFVPVVIAIALLSFTCWIIFGTELAFTHALLSLVTVLVIACPCALGLATPTAIMVGIGKGAENGILIRDAESLEKAHQVEVVVLDKTGTITEGKPSLTGIKWKAGADTSYLESILYNMEKQSGHPLAEAVIQYLEEKTVQLENLPVQTSSIPGMGIQATFNGKTWYIGNQQLILQQSIETEAGLTIDMLKWQQEANTVFFFADDKETKAIISVTDPVKVTSRAAIAQLIANGLEVYMLTGDNEHTAKAVAEKTGIPNYLAEMLPQDKFDFIKELQQKGKVVAMVGDGINDSQALAQADVSIAMGKGSDIAMDVAKMTIISSDLLKIPAALRLSRQTVTTIRQNLFWAFIYNIIGIPIAAGILYPAFGFLLNPMIAGAAMALSSVSVVSNSLRLKFLKL